MGLKSQVQTFESTPYYTKTGSIQTVRDVSNTNPYNDEWDPWDIGIEVAIEFQKRDGESYLKKIYVGGNLEFNQDGSVKSWGRTGWRLDQWLKRFGIMVGYDPIPEIIGKAVPKEINQFLVGREVMILNYVTGVNENRDGAYYYNTFDVVLPLDPNMTLDDMSANLIDLFLKQVEKGYPKSYKPHVIPPVRQQQESHSVVQNSLSPAGIEDEQFDPDGDSGLPF